MNKILYKYVRPVLKLMNGFIMLAVAVMVVKMFVENPLIALVFFVAFSIILSMITRLARKDLAKLAKEKLDEQAANTVNEGD